MQAPVHPLCIILDDVSRHALEPPRAPEASIRVGLRGSFTIASNAKGVTALFYISNWDDEAATVPSEMPSSHCSCRTGDS